MVQRPRTRRTGRRPCSALAGCLLGLAAMLGAWQPGAAAEVRFFRLESARAFLAGTLEGIGVDPLGTLQLGVRVDRLSDVGEPFLFDAVPHPRGWVVGTGNAGAVLLVDREGAVTSLFATEEPEVFAVLADDDGTVYAASSPHGKVYRIREGKGEVFFDPEETYIWDLARAANGDLLVATGTEGRLYRVGEDGEGRVFFDGEDTHLRVLKALPSGEVLVGTAGEGLILKLDDEGVARTLFDAPQPEVVAFAAEPDGDCFAAVLASEASLMDLSRGTASGAESGAQPESEEVEGEQGGSEEFTVTVEASPAQSGTITGSRPPGFKGPRSEILRISPRGAVESLLRFDDETVYALLWHRDRLWVGTGLEGKLYSVKERRPVLEEDVDERQVVALLPDSPGPAFATTNAAALYRLSGETEPHGTYTSPSLDAGQMASFGSLRWRGEVPSGSSVRFSFRSGMSAAPDRTWTPWSTPMNGREISLAGVSSGRYLQWRAELAAVDGRSPSLHEVTVSYRQANLPPRIASFSTLPPGQILVPANFNPSNQVFEPAHPNRQGIFTTLEARPRDGDARLKPLWKMGYRTLRWEASDPNEDTLRYSLAFRPAEGDLPWLEMAEDLEETHYGFDSTVLPDGYYRFRLRASDRGREDEEILLDEEVSESILIDHTPPFLSGVDRERASWSVRVGDSLSPLREASVSVDAGEWQQVPAADGLLDGQAETLVVEAPQKGELVLLRLTDAAFNLVTIDISEGGK